MTESIFSIAINNLNIGIAICQVTDGRIDTLFQNPISLEMGSPMEELIWEAEASQQQQIDINQIGDYHWEDVAIPVSPYVIVMTRDCTDIVLKEERYCRDPLTNVFGRSHFEALANSALAQRGANLALLFIDLNKFKPVNDTYGHAAGDALLMAVASRIKLALREGDIVGRYGGDEFVCLLHGIGCKTDAAIAADRIWEYVTKPLDIDGRQISPKVSIGIALRSAKLLTFEALCHEADAAMYRCKRQGSHFCFADEQAWFKTKIASSLVSDFWEALEADDQLMLHYQEIRSLDASRNPKNYAIAGYEALLRWNHPKKGLLYPKNFLPKLEAAELHKEITKWVVMAASEKALQLRHGEYIAVNISPSMPPADLAEISSHIGKMLSIEITESSIHFLDLISVILDLKSQGVRLLLDDWGTGYSNFARTVSLPWDTIKIDRSLKKTPKIIPGIVDIIHATGAKALIEGIEPCDLEVLRLAIDCGVEYGQGWMWGRGDTAPLINLTR